MLLVSNHRGGSKKAQKTAELNTNIRIIETEEGRMKECCLRKPGAY
jgi:hypothetical protein